MKTLPKYLTIIGFTMTVWGAFLVPQAQSATVYAVSAYVDKQIPLATSTSNGPQGEYIRYPNDTIYKGWSGSISGTPISVPSFNRIAFFITDTNLTTGQMSGSALFFNGSNQATSCASGGTNIYVCNITATTTISDLSFVPSNVLGGWAVMGGSSLNPGVSDTGPDPAQQVTGGYAFLLCDTTCGAFVQRASLSASELLSGVSTSTVAATCDGGVATSSGLLDSIGSSIANGMCRVGVFLFVPSPGAISQWQAIGSQVVTKAPISYAVEVRDAYEAFVATSSETFPALSLNLGTTSGFLGGGNIELLSEDKVEQFAGSTALSLLRGLLASVFWLMAIAFVYRQISGLWHKQVT